MSIGRAAAPRLRRGDICIVDFGQPRGNEQGGKRPAVIVSTDDLNEVSSTLIVAAITKRLPSADRPRPQHVHITARGTGLDYDGMVKVDQVVTVDAVRVERTRARLTPEVIERLNEALFYVLGLDDQPGELVP